MVFLYMAPKNEDAGASGQRGGEPLFYRVMKRGEAG